ncbi:DUF937 domain-containing protein [Meiothermus sp. CFH 77666]|uniref:DUF937 domain-containing protein n=1 Tax=Meiothermus sp. CFH 77666 TaxID=2817942 RepID=UPI001AA08648|nr:DUF937 domain-containing protein [Meiothermus sp. CFH 77666]MBO1437168.1 DUF937 domain-containing protein [Meiothermus sp. CFH 77666]
MAGLMDLLGAALNENTIKQMAGQLGASDTQVQSAIGMALPALLQGLQRNAADPKGAESLAAALDRDHDGSVLDDLMGFLGQAQQGPGAGILRHVLGDHRATVQQGIGQAAGINPNQVGSLLEMLAPIVMGALGKTTRQQGAGAGGLLDLLEQATGQMQQQQPQAFNLVNMLLDQNRDGNVVDDVVRMLGNFLKR